MDIIIYPPTINWTFMKQRPQQLMKKFADSGYTVFYCNQTQSEKEIEEISPNLFVVHNHDQWLKQTLPNIRKRENRKVGIWCSWAKLSDSLKRYNPDWIIYDCVDEFPDWLKYEPKMIEMADAVVCTAEKLEKRLRNSYPNKRIELIRNAYDQEMLLHTLPSQNQNKKKIGYIGAWASWIDDVLINKLALSIKNAEIEIIGTEFGKKFNLHHLHNVHFLGQKPHSELPQFMQYFTVCIIPFRINPTTIATNPVKMYEYLATGKPVISTNLPECRLAQPYVDVANNHMDFILKVKDRLHNPGDLKERKDYALKNTWSHRVNQAIHLIRDISK
ncbi:glycosyltransferase [Sutcliffiella cohnii]